MSAETTENRHWTDIEPADAVDIVLPAEGIEGPINELGEPCPWPWDPQQLTGAPLGQYHCGYCGGMAMAGESHFDASDLDDDDEEDS